MLETVIGITVVILLITASVLLIYRLLGKKRVRLEDRQFVTDVFDIGCAKKWFEEKCNGDRAGKKLFLAYLTPDVQKRMKISCIGMDPEHYIVIALIKDKDILEYQFVNFGCVEQNFSQLLDKNSGKLIIEA